MIEFFRGLMDSNFMPHGACYQWQPDIVGLHVFSDSVIALAYFSIPFFLIRFVRQRKDLAFRWMFILFGAFILACGTTHLLEVWTVWHGTYRLTGVVKLTTAAVSMGTAVMLGPLVPKALALPSPASMQQANEALAREVEERRQAEEALRELNAELEARVRARTAELEERNRQLEHEIAEHKQTEQALKWARDEAEAASRIKSAFLANMSHEIRTPLTGIIGFAGVLAKQAEGQQRQFAQLIERGGHRLLDLLNAVLTLAKLESTQEEAARRPVELNGAVHEATRLLQPNAEKKALDLHVETPDEPVWASLDEGALHSILNNLVGNAIKFTEEGRVTVTLEADADTVHLRVTDTGCGIDPDFVPHLFDAFTQSSTGFSRSHEGSGLGLSITHRLVQMLDGTIDVDTTPGTGSTFTVTFPRLHEPDNGDVATNQAPDRSVEPPADGAAQLLIVEDNEETRTLMEHVLGELGTITTAVDAQAALQHVRSTSFDLILVDIHLGPGADGSELLHMLRAHPTTHGTPMVAVTAYALPGDRDKFIEAGFDAYLGKPFETDELLALSAQLLRNHRSSQEDSDAA